MTIEVEADGFTARRGIDTMTIGAIVLAVDAMLFSLTAVLGVPALIWLFADEIASWDRLWLVVVVWLVACVLAPLCTVATLRLAGRGSRSVRRVGTAAALGTAAATSVLAVMSMVGAPGILGVMAGLLAIANVAAARVLFLAPDPSPELSPVPAAPIAEPFTESDLLVISEEPGPNQADPNQADPNQADPDQTDPNQGVSRLSGRTRSRGPAALRTLAGVRLPPRARGARR